MIFFGSNLGRQRCTGIGKETKIATKPAAELSSKNASSMYNFNVINQNRGNRKTTQELEPDNKD